MDVAFALSWNDSMHAPPGHRFAIPGQDLDTVIESIGDIDEFTVEFDAGWFGEHSRKASPVSVLGSK